jgi:hypothetical protein
MGLLSAHARRVIVFASRPAPWREHEQFRQTSIAKLPNALADLDIREVIVERRERTRDLRDRESLIPGMRRHMGPDAILEHQSPSDEVLLWLADAVAGAVNDKRDRCPCCLATLEGRFRLL